MMREKDLELEEKLLKEFKDRYAFWRHEGYSPGKAKEKAIREMLFFRRIKLFLNCLKILILKLYLLVDCFKKNLLGYKGGIE